MIRRALRGALWCLALFAPVARAQSVDPPFAVYQGRARSSVLISNPSLQPLAFVIEPMSFDIAACGDLGLAPLDTARIRLALSSMSGRIPAKQSRRIFYDARTDSLPAWFALKIAFGPARRDSGMSIRLELTHFVYLTQEAPVLPEEIVASEAHYDPVRRRVSIRVENRGGRLTRLHSVGLVDAADEERAVEACPLLPRHAREFEFPWKEPLPPRAVRLRFPGFMIERVVRPTAVAPDATRSGSVPPGSQP
ncbi:MAG: hypothetical protein ACO32Z_04755 [Gemmatimonadaceae bacterium]|jgi:hypothetical protein